MLYTLPVGYIVTVLKIIIYSNIVCYCSRTSEMYLKLNVI